MSNPKKLNVGFAFWACAIVPILSPFAWARPLPSDSRFQTGELKNGVTWVFRHHDNPPGKMALLVHVKTGSLNETEAQRGLAHFLEHMAFNGTENFAPGKLIPYFESVGMEFGADLNAFTSFDQTCYMLFLPDTEAAQIDKAMTVLSDYMFRMLLTDEEIDKERGVILEEKRRGKGFDQRMRDILWPELFDGTLFAERLPIGLEEVIKDAKRDRFVDYYRTWYRPENVTLIAVGDAEKSDVLPAIEKWFGQYKPELPTSQPHTPGFKPFATRRAFVVTDPEMPYCEVEMTKIMAGRPPVTTVEQWRTKLVEYVGNWILSRRCEERVNKGEASYREAETQVEDFFHDALWVAGRAEGEPKDWTKMLEELVMEVNRAGQFGFTPREFELAKKKILAEAEHAVETESTQNARRLLFKATFTLNDDEPILSAKEELDLNREFLPSVSLAEVSESFKNYFQPGAFSYVVRMADKEGVSVPSQEDVLAAAAAAWARTVEAPVQEEAPTELLSALPEPGGIAESTTDSDLNITSAQLTNGVRVHHRFMDYKKDSVLVSISLAGGPIEETEANAGITQVAALAINEAATNRLTSTNVRDIMTGKNINVRAYGEGDSLRISVTGSPKDLETGLQLVYALLTDGKIEDSAFKNWKLRTLQDIERREINPMFRAFEGTQALMSGDDPRQRFISKSDVEKQSVAKAQAWFDRLRSKAPIEVAVVGDIHKDEALALAARYLGSLSKRPASAGYLDALRKLARPTGPLARHIEVETMTPQAMAIARFAGSEGRNVADTRALTVAQNILTSRLVKRIREELSIVYSIRAQDRPSWVYADAGIFASGAPCDPKNVNRVVEEIHAIFADFTERGPTVEELDNAKKQIANNLDTDMKEPDFWWDILDHLDLHGRKLNDVKDEKDAFAAMTAKQVQGAMNKYYTPARKFQVTAVPTKAEAGDEKARPAASAAPSS